MSQLPWVSEVAEETRPDEKAEAAGGPGTLAVSAHEFAALEERVLRAVNLVKRERLERTAAEERAVQAEAREQQRAAEFETLQKEVQALRAERDAVRQRVEKVLAQLDELEA
jgi:FtsZ-binding cell division protein ZapB